MRQTQVPKHRVHLLLDKEVHEALKRLAAVNGITVSDAIRLMIRNGLAMNGLVLKKEKS